MSQIGIFRTYFIVFGPEKSLIVSSSLPGLISLAAFYDISPFALNPKSAFTSPINDLPPIANDLPLSALSLIVFLPRSPSHQLHRIRNDIPVPIIGDQ